MSAVPALPASPLAGWTRRLLRLLADHEQAGHDSRRGLEPSIPPVDALVAAMDRQQAAIRQLTAEASVLAERWAAGAPVASTLGVVLADLQRTLAGPVDPDGAVTSPLVPRHRVRSRTGPGALVPG